MRRLCFHTIQALYKHVGINLYPNDAHFDHVPPSSLYSNMATVVAAIFMEILEAVTGKLTRDRSVVVAGSTGLELSGACPTLDKLSVSG